MANVQPQPRGPTPTPSIRSRILKGVAVAATPLVSWGVARVVIWIMTNPHIFLFTWMLGLGLATFAEYITGQGINQLVLPGQQSATPPENLHTRPSTRPSMVTPARSGPSAQQNEELPPPSQGLTAVRVSEAIATAPSVLSGNISSLIRRRQKSSTPRTERPLIGLTPSFLDKNRNKRPEEEWGAFD